MSGEYGGGTDRRPAGRGEREPETGPERSRRTWLLVGLFLGFPAALHLLAGTVVPSLSWPLEDKSWTAAALVVTGEVGGLLVGLLLGKELASRYRSYLSPRYWYRRTGGKERAPEKRPEDRQGGDEDDRDR